MRKNLWIVACVLCIALPAGPALAEKTLWLKYHFAAEEAFSQGQYARAENLFKAAERESVITLRPENHRLASTLDGLGRVYMAQERYEDAEECFNRALEMKRTVLGPHTREIPKTIVNLAKLRYAEGKLDKVERLYRHALLILVRDQTDLSVTESLNGLARLYMDQGEYTKAETLLERARSIHIEARRRNHPEMAATLALMGRLYFAQGRFEECVPVCEEALEIRMETLGDSHPDLAESMVDFAAVLRKFSKDDEAAELDERATRVREAYARTNEFYAQPES